ncbi:MAG: 3-deoxy-D-manno-octulosonate [Desulfovibrionaceae bacterium]|nr:MAG: 3-deoxy-D-manno-octulosonate [Desulfovibrionaceae bacterium]
MPNVIAVIAARMGSTRFPGKPLVPVHGIPMLGHVYLRTRMCRLLDEVYVATCDKEIYDYVLSLGGKAVMTADTHERCSDRTAEAVVNIAAQGGKPVDIVLMVQGDEPLVTPVMLEQVLAPMLADPTLPIANLMGPIKTAEQFEDRNEVKVVTDLAGNAMYLSREPIPSLKMGDSPATHCKQMGIIAFRRDYLMRFNALEPTPLERRESVDMLRVLEHGDTLRMVLTNEVSMGVDTPQDMEEAARLLSKDPLLPMYSQRGTV